MSVTVIEVDEVGVVAPVEVEEMVARGMELLDREFGTSFVEKINIDVLDISSGINCALGQCYGSYAHARQKLELSARQAVEHGFDVDRNDSRNGTYARLTQAWKDALLARSA